MVSSEKILSALRANWVLNALGLLLSFGASVVLVRAIPRELFAQYAAVLAIVGVATLVFEAGANSGLTRYLREASECGAAGTFYLRMQRRRLGRRDCLCGRGCLARARSMPAQRSSAAPRPSAGFSSVWACL